MEIFTNGGQYFNDLLIQHIKHGNNKEVYSILENANPAKFTDDSGSTLLHIAAKYGNIWLLRNLIHFQANINAQNHNMETPLMFAVKYRKIETVKILLEAGADIYIPDNVGFSALKKAFEIRHKDIFTMIRDKVTSESVEKSEYAENPYFHQHFSLYYFVVHKNADVIRSLIRKGSPLNVVRSDTGETALHVAMKRLEIDKVKVLLQYGVDVNIKNKNGKTALDYLRDLRDCDEALVIIEMLISAGSNLINKNKCQSLVNFLIQHGSSKIVRHVLKHLKKLDLHNMDKRYGWTPLHRLAQNKNPNSVAELSGYDFDTEIRSRKLKWTMLHFAVRAGNIDSIRFLLDRGAQIEVTCTRGLTPLDYIIVNHKINGNRLDTYMEIIEILLARNANPCIMTSSNYRYMRVIFHNFVPDTVITMMRPIVAHMSLIETDIDNEILRNPELNMIYEAKKLLHESMKEIELGKSITLLDFLRATDERISLFAQNQISISITSSEMRNYNLDLYYQLKFSESYTKFNNLFEMRKRAAIAIDKIFVDFYNVSVYGVAEIIVYYLGDQDLKYLG